MITQKSKKYISIHAEENGNLTDGNVEYSFGNGTDANNNYGFAMPANGKIISCSICAAAAASKAGQITASLLINGTQNTNYQIVKPSNVYSSASNFQTPLNLSAGDRINFISKSTNSSVTHSLISLLIVIDINNFFNKTKQEHNQINDVILKSALVYQYLYHKHFGIYISIEHILEKNDGEIGLIGPGNGCITMFLEKLFGWSDIIHSHSIIHDAFGRFYNHYGLDRGYLYMLSTKFTPKCLKGNPLCGQVIGITFCIQKNYNTIFLYICVRASSIGTIFPTN